MSDCTEGTGPAIHTRTGYVNSVRPHTPGSVMADVCLHKDAAGSINAKAIGYTSLIGPVCAGDEVLLNVTAMDLELGTGGVHFIICVLPGEGPLPDRLTPLSGHLMKLRYLPHQCAVYAAEEEHSPYRNVMEEDKDLEGCPVVVCELHSQVPAIAAGFLASRSGKVVYIMTQGAALALPFSRLVPEMRRANLIQSVITAGQCFGGDLEAINIYSALLLARHALNSDLIIVAQGPGNAGTGTRFGFSGIDQGEAANAAASLGGRPIVCLRASSADPRIRHQTPSYHTITVLDRVVRCRCVVAIARDAPGARRKQILQSLCSLRLHDRHDIMEDYRGDPGLQLLAERTINPTTMGRTLLEDQEFFLHASAAGAAAAGLAALRVT